MKPSLKALDRNLSRLLREAYVPVAPRAEFREELEARLARSIGAIGARTRTVAAPAAGRRVPWLAAAAALLLLPFLTFVAARIVARFDGTGLAEPDAFLAAGKAAVTTPAGGWRAVTDDEVAHGVALPSGDALELRTPPGLEVGLDARSASVAAFGATTLRASRVEDGFAVELAAGGLEATLAEPGELRVDTREGSLALERGALTVELGPDAATLVASDLARGPNGRALPSATRLVLRDGAIVRDDATLVGGPETDDGDRASAERTPAAADTTDPDGAPDEEPDQEAVAPTLAVLRGRVRTPEGADALDAYRVIVLREVLLPRVAEPEQHLFAADATTPPRFELRLEPGRYKVFVQADGCATWLGSGVDLVPGEPRELDVTLVRGGAVAGVVTDDDGRPIEGAYVLSEQAAPTQVLPLDLGDNARAAGAVVTDHLGRFELPSLAPGPHLVRASAPGHGAAWSGPLEVDAGGRVDDVRLELGPEAVLHGRVAHEDGSPWSGAYVVASLIDYTFQRPCMTGDHGVSAEDGTYEVRGLPAGTYVVLNSSEMRAGTTPAIRSAVVPAGARVRVDLPGDLGARVRGTLRDADGAPLRGLDVTLTALSNDGTFRSARTDTDGEFLFPNLAPDVYAGYVSREMGADLTLLGLMEVPAVPELRHDFQLSAGGLHGRVLADGKPLADAVVVLERADAGAPVQFVGKDLTDADGNYEFPGLPAGEYDVGAFATSGMLGEERLLALVLYDEQRRELPPLELRPGGALTVQVVDDAERPLEGARVELYDPTGRLAQYDLDGRTDPAGELSIEGMSLGAWTVSATAPHPSAVGSGEPASVERSVEIREGVTSVLRLVLPR